MSNFMARDIIKVHKIMLMFFTQNYNNSTSIAIEHNLDTIHCVIPKNHLKCQQGTS